MKKSIAALFLSILAMSVMAQQTIMRCMSGYIDSYPITMFLCHEENYYFGSYYFDATKTPIELYGSLDSSGLVILESDNGLQTERFSGRLGLNGFQGDWVSDADSLFVGFTLKDNDYSQHFEWVSYKEHRLLNKEEEYPYASFYAGGSFPSKTLNVCDTVRNVLFMDALSSNDYNNQLQENAKSFFDEFNKFNEDDENSDAGMSGTREAYSYIFPIYMDDAEVIFKLYTYDYVGGAHGMSSSLYFMFDREKNRYIPENDLLQNTQDGALGGILYRCFVNKYGEENAGMLFSNERNLRVPDNFYITPGEICFQYQEYEIGPYVMGNLSVHVPLSDVKEYLTPYAKELFLR